MLARQATVCDTDNRCPSFSGFTLLEFGDLVLADGGFLIGDEIAARNCFLSIPAFTRGQGQLTQQQVETSRSIARVRIHVEWAIGD